MSRLWVRVLPEAPYLQGYILTKLINHYNSLNKILDSEERQEILSKYNEWITTQPSIIDGDWNCSKPHHVRIAGHCGIGQKPNDLFQVPITYQQHHDHHQKGKYQNIFIEKLPELHDCFMLECNIQI